MGIGAPALNTNQRRDIPQPGPPFAATSADNGLSVDPVTGRIVLGGDVGSPSQMLSVRVIEMSGFSVDFSSVFTLTRINPGGVSISDSLSDIAIGSGSIIIRNVLLGLDQILTGNSIQYNTSTTSFMQSAVGNIWTFGRLNSANRNMALSLVTGSFAFTDTNITPVPLNGSTIRVQSGGGIGLNVSGTAVTFKSMFAQNTNSGGSTIIELQNNGFGLLRAMITGTAASPASTAILTSNQSLVIDAGSLSFISFNFGGLFTPAQEAARFSPANRNLLINTTVDAAAGLKLQVNGSASVTDIITATPGGSGAGTWKMGTVVAGASVLDATKFVEVSINGVLTKLAVVV